MKKRNAYVKQINKNLFHVCLEYGIKTDDMITGLGIVNDYKLKSFNDIDKALTYKNKFND